ncbi:MAG: chemotaxis response regulator protein-glutamate methylesterase [Campylobacteraceae bacterium]|nr:chemotaxis response regulator protein-glutamate methylesterase [Campylobacteraceae bacterium]
MGLHVLVVDDSATARAVLTSILQSDPEIESVETAPDAYVARDKMLKQKPDVICLDVEMPRMDGISFLRKLMRYMPTPVVMVSSLTTKGATTTLDALEAGAVDFIPKMHANLYEGKSSIQDELLEKVKAAARAKVSAKKPIKSTSTEPLSYKTLTTTQKLIAIGSSTGGTEALKTLLSKMPANAPGILVAQHMPASFTLQFANRLNDLCAMEVKEAQNGDPVGVGKVLIAPGDKHMVLRRSGARYYVEIGEGKKVSGHRPSVDVLFNSVAKSAGKNAIGVILTGMGSDGARGLLNLRESGAITLGQDEASSVVYGMPKVAYDLGAVESQVSLDEMSAKILEKLSTMET